MAGRRNRECVFLNARRRHRGTLARESGGAGAVFEPADDVEGGEEKLRRGLADRKGAVLKLGVEGGLALLLLFSLGDGGAERAAGLGTERAGDGLAERELADVFAKHASPCEHLHGVPLAAGSQEPSGQDRNDF